MPEVRGDRLVLVSTGPRAWMVGPQGYENKVEGGHKPHLREDAAAAAAPPGCSCCFVPLQRAEIAQINLLFA